MGLCRCVREHAEVAGVVDVEYSHNIIGKMRKGCVGVITLMLGSGYMNSG